MPLTKLGELMPGSWYIRVSRTSTQRGVSNGVRVCCSWQEEEETRYDGNGETVNIRQKITFEHIILNRKTEGSEFCQVKFGLPGDSGSILIDRYDQACGLCYVNAKW